MVVRPPQRRYRRYWSRGGAVLRGWLLVLWMKRKQPAVKRVVVRAQARRLLGCEIFAEGRDDLPGRVAARRNA